ncbi:MULTISPECIES: EamA family transporter [Arthrobacter]|uniref:EamA family transporter n=2 Tax=Arthrobacter TaxID=1663 RepID=A0ABU9KK32_9MICC|nr:EamA family transporter [Arthrobacter sp. YJM1]MDP5226281.1 EamA family transporter [Arthrobacter sp. YJM1]
MSSDAALDEGTAAAAAPSAAKAVRRRPMPLVAVTVLGAMAPLSLGTTYLVTTDFLPAGHPLFAALDRSLPAGLIALLLGRAWPRGVWWFRAILLGLLNIGFFLPLLFISAARLPGGVAATLFAVQPLMVVFLAVAVLREKLVFQRLAWAVIGAVGVALVVLGRSAGLDAVGVLAALVGTGSMALGVVLTKKWGTPNGVRPIAVVGWQLTAGGLFLLPLTLLSEGFPAAVDARGLAGYLWVGVVCGLLSYSLWFWAIGRLPVTRASLLGFLSPLMAAGLGVLVKRETFGPLQLVGLVLAFGAMLLGQRGGRRTGV